MEGQEGPFGVNIAEKRNRSVCHVLAVKIGYDTNLRFIVEMSKTRPVDSRRSSSTTGIFDVIDGELGSREGCAMSLDEL